MHGPGTPRNKEKVGYLATRRESIMRVAVPGSDYGLFQFRLGPLRTIAKLAVLPGAWRLPRRGAAAHI